MAEFADLLKEHNIKLLIDVRTVPRSRTNPQFNKDSLSQDLPTNHDVKYIWMGAELGGLRKMDKTSVLNAGWDNASFRGEWRKAEETHADASCNCIGTLSAWT